MADLASYQTHLPSHYLLNSMLPDQGGMGMVFHATDLSTNTKIIIKFLNYGSDSERARFLREVRLLKKYSDEQSPFTIPILDSSLDCEIPYFVMPVAESDLTKVRINSFEETEVIFTRLIDCIEYLHSRGDLHRDIKPENFLVFQGNIVVSDLGLAKDPNSETVFTQSVHHKGTFAYAPPRFFEDGGFKYAENCDDIYCLGKTFYFLLTQKIPRFIRPHESIPSTVFHVIQKMTEEDESKRFQNCHDLRRELITAFDLILGRNNDMGTLYKNWRNLKPDDLQKLLTNLKLMPFEKRMSFLDDIALTLAEKISTKDEYVPIAEYLILAYEDIVESIAESRKRIDFSYAEYIAKVMAVLFKSYKVSIHHKAKALEVALTISIRFNRIAAEKVCGKLIESIDNDGLALLCARVIDNVANDSFLEYHVSPYECSHPLIQDLILKANPSLSI